MAMATLVSKESNESFYSTHSHQETPSLSHVSPDDIHSAAFEKGVPIYNVDAYLNDPRNQEHGTSPPAKSPLHKEQKAGDGSASSKPCTPVQLGAPRTSYHVTALYQLCQERGLRAEFELDGDHSRWFGGMVTVGAQTLASEQRWRTKKEAKEGLAELALPVAREMEAVWKQKAEQASQEKNWVGMLLEYHNATDPIHAFPGPIYTEYALGHHFACTCTIPSSQSIYGSSTVPFPSKKAARINAAKEAVQYLISIAELNPSGSPKGRRKIKSGSGEGPIVRVEGEGLEVKKDVTYAARVNELAHRLSLPPPMYRLSPASSAAPNLLSGAAYFSGVDAAYHPLLSKPVGEVRNVFGKKNGKEECARGVWEVLREVARERGVEIEAE
ncbi:MAG: hypothetical protein LQ345_004750 [Seirophora villosa]|nr:MAG: hypothetical protein LQ345_004750 [Seirophora villosa]